MYKKDIDPQIESGREQIEWLELFARSKERPLRVLHVGNIANNAYLNAKMLRKLGVESYVLCADYFHVMGCPEWEEGDFRSGWLNDYRPRWQDVDFGAFERPDWFVQGPFNICVRYICARFEDKRFKAGLYWRLLRWHNVLYSYPVLYGFICQGVRLLGLVKMALLRLAALISQVVKRTSVESDDAEVSHWRNNPRLEALVYLFAQYFPDRKDQLDVSDFKQFTSRSDAWESIVKHFDLVHAYATEGLYPLLVGASYVAFEHGTIRSLPFNDSPTGRLCALAYRAAKVALIRNSDNIDAAEKLCLDNYRFIPHPINEDYLDVDEQSVQLSKQLHDQVNANFLIFHPSRQHWSDKRDPDWEKGNDIFFRGFARFCNEVNPRAAGVFVDWGNTVAESKELLEKLGVADRVIWINPQSNRWMIRYIHATDMLADQFYLGAFGSTMPKALACGRPAMMYLNESCHRWCFDKMPPVLNVRTDEDVFNQLTRCWRNESYRESIAKDGLSWYHDYHSNAVISKILLASYQQAITA